jgi:hypothetical protein
MRFSSAGLLMSVPLVLAMGAVVVSSTAREAWAQATSSVFSAENAPVKKLPKPRAPGTQPPSGSPSVDSSSAVSSGSGPTATKSGGFYGSRVR